MRGTNVLFIVDRSGSMHTEFAPVGDFEPGPDDRDLNRLETAKRELLRAVRGLPSDARFNLITFADDVKKWRPALVPATASARQALLARARRLAPKGATNLFGALKAGLAIKTLAYGTRYGTEVDEIFLLSDGEPTAGEVVDTSKILGIICETNRHSGVRINTLYMGGGGDSDFMRKLAERNGGTYTRL